MADACRRSSRPRRAASRAAQPDGPVRQADTTNRAVLDALDVAVFDHIIVLCYSDALEPQRADARTLITLLHLRDIAGPGAVRTSRSCPRCSTCGTAPWPR